MLKSWCRAKERQINSKKSTVCPNDLYNWERQYALTKVHPDVKKRDVQKEYRVRLGRKIVKLYARISALHAST